MPRQQVRKQSLSTFSKGLLTEANPLAYPDDTLVSGDNIDVLRNGSAKRRRGIDFEAGGAFSPDRFQLNYLKQAAITTYEWKSVAAKDNLNFSVQQVGGTLYFHKLGEVISSTNVIGKLDLTPIRTNTDFWKEPFDFSAGKGKLFVVGRYISPAYIEYDEDENKFVGVKLTLRVRDIDGIPEDDESPVVFEDGDGQIDYGEPTDTRDFDFLDILDQIDGVYDFVPFIRISGPTGLF